MEEGEVVGVRASRRGRSRWAAVGSWSMASAWSGWVAMTTASYAVVAPFPSVTSTASAVSRTEVTLVPTRHVVEAGRDPRDVLAGSRRRPSATAASR